MSTHTKLRGRKDDTIPELTRFKKLWRTLPEPERDYWRALFISDSTQAQNRKLLLDRYQINFTRDGQLNDFRDWEIEQRKLDLEAERMEEDERRSAAEHPEWSKDQLREEVLRRAYLRARSTGDFKLGLATVKVDLKSQDSQLEREKWAEAQRTKIEAGLEAIFQEIKGNAAAEELFARMKEVVAKGLAPA